MTTETDFLERIESSDRIDSTDTVQEAVRATTETLGERITDGQAEDLAESLPEIAAESLQSTHPREAAVRSRDVLRPSRHARWRRNRCGSRHHSSRLRRTPRDYC